MGRTNFEQKLKRDISTKNQVSSRLGNLIREAAGYRSSAQTTGNRRWQKKYAATAERLSRQVDELTKTVLQSGDDLEKRIHEEAKISESEIRDFKARFEKEVAEAKAAAAKQKKSEDEWAFAERSFNKASAEEQEKLAQLATLAAQAKAKTSREQEDVKKADREVASEERDKLFFRLELERITAERSALRKPR